MLEGDRALHIDDHGSRVGEPVWSLFAHFMEHSEAIPTLVEWDSNVPSLCVLLEEAEKVNAILEQERNSHFR